MIERTSIVKNRGGAQSVAQLANFVRGNVEKDQKIEPLSGEDAERVEKQRAWVRGHFEPDARHKYSTIEGKLRLIETILEAGWIEPSETWKLQSLGIALGDAVAQKMGLNWVAVQDDLGRDPALSLPRTSILVFPLTWISKRIERGEKVDVIELYASLCQTVERMQSEGY